jgi:2-methylcitrate dehydratase PrpD
MQTVMEKAPVLQKLAEFIHAAHDFNDPTCHQVKRVIADTVGCSFSGVKTKAFSCAFERKDELFGPGNHPVWGTTDRTSMPGAVFFNTLSVSCTDYDEGHRKAVGHPASLVVPASLVLGRYLHSSNTDILNAIIIGYEIGTRFSHARIPESIDTYSSGRWGAIGTAASCAYLMKLGTEQTMHCLSLASVLSPAMLGGSIDVSTGSMAKEGVPWAAFVGLQSAIFARSGFVGPYVFAEDPSRYESSKLLPNPAYPLMIESNYFKPYACCRWLHTALREAIEIKQAHAIKPENIQKITVDVFGRALQLIDARYPENPIQAQFHLPYAVAIALQHGKVTPEYFELDLMDDKAIRALIDKTVLVERPAYSELFPGKLLSKVTVELLDGEVIGKEIDNAPWDAANPPSDRELQEKFEDQVGEIGQQLWDTIFEGNFLAF